MNIKLTHKFFDNYFGTPTVTNVLIVRNGSEKNNSIGPDGISGEILKLGGEAMIPYLGRLLDITMNNDTLPADWKRAVALSIHKRV
jgi:hypothetical protein